MQLVLLGRGALVLAELLDEGAGVGEAAVHGHLGHVHIGGGEEVGGALDAVVVEVVDGRAVHDGAEVAAEVLRREAGEPGQGLQGDVLAVVLLDVLQRGLELLGLLPGALGDGVQLGRADVAQLRAQKGEHRAQHVDAAGAEIRGSQIEQARHSALEPGIGFNRTTFQKDVVAQQRPQRLAAGFDARRERLGVEHDALVDAVFRLAAVNHAAAHGQQIARPGQQLAVVQKQAHLSAAHANDLGLLVPVHRHAVAGKALVHVVVIQRKVPRAVRNLLVIIQVVHGKATPFVMVNM